MPDQLTAPVTFIVILGCGVTAGFMFAFSAFVMDALGRPPAPQGIAAMQTINVVIISPLFLLRSHLKNSWRALPVKGLSEWNESDWTRSV